MPPTRCCISSSMPISSSPSQCNQHLLLLRASYKKGHFLRGKTFALMGLFDGLSRHWGWDAQLLPALPAGSRPFSIADEDGLHTHLTSGSSLPGTKSHPITPIHSPASLQEPKELRISVPEPPPCCPQPIAEHLAPRCQHRAGPPLLLWGSIRGGRGGG